MSNFSNFLTVFKFIFFLVFISFLNTFMNISVIDYLDKFLFIEFNDLFSFFIKLTALLLLTDNDIL